MQPISGIIIAGGRSRRLGVDKRRLRLWGPAGPTLLEHTLVILAPLCAELLVVLNDPEDWRNLSACLIPDCYPDAGALGGIYAGLRAATYSHALIVAADMPFLNHNLLKAMLAHQYDYDALMPRAIQTGTTRNLLNVEPLHAVYGRTCLTPLQAILERGERRVTALLSTVRVVTIEPEEIVRYDPVGFSFYNINTPADLATVQQLITARR